MTEQQEAERDRAIMADNLDAALKELMQIEAEIEAIRRRLSGVRAHLVMLSTGVRYKTAPVPADTTPLARPLDRRNTVVRCVACGASVYISATGTYPPHYKPGVGDALGGECEANGVLHIEPDRGEVSQGG